MSALDKPLQTDSGRLLWMVPKHKLKYFSRKPRSVFICNQNFKHCKKEVEGSGLKDVEWK